MKANPDTDNARRHKSAKHPQEKITVPLLLSLIFLNSKPRLLTSYGKKRPMSGPSFTFPPRAAITTRHQESVKPRKITQTLGNVKSLPPFINRKNSKHETTTTEKEEEEEKTTEATYLFPKQKKPRKNGAAPPPINRMQTKKIKIR